MKDPEIILRAYRPDDLSQIEQLFYDTVHTVNARDYSPEQLQAWATGRIDREEWNRSLLEHRSIVAVKGREIVGFGDMDSNGYLDRESPRPSATGWRAQQQRGASFYMPLSRRGRFLRKEDTG